MDEEARGGDVGGWTWVKAAPAYGWVRVWLGNWPPEPDYDLATDPTPGPGE